jgi:hypothetical protein
MALEPLETAEGSDYPYCRQLSVFFENRVGQLLRLTRLFEGEAVHILGISVDSTIDCAIVRLIVDDPDTAAQMLRDAGFAVSITEMIVVELPPGKRGIMTLCAALISGEVNINYVYPLIATVERPSCLAVHVDHLAQAAATLIKRRFRVLDETDL